MKTLFRNSFIKALLLISLGLLQETARADTNSTNLAPSITDITFNSAGASSGGGGASYAYAVYNASSSNTTPGTTAAYSLPMTCVTASADFSCNATTGNLTINTPGYYFVTSNSFIAYAATNTGTFTVKVNFYHSVSGTQQNILGASAPPLQYQLSTHLPQATVYVQAIIQYNTNDYIVMSPAFTTSSANQALIIPYVALNVMRVG